MLLESCRLEIKCNHNMIYSTHGLKHSQYVQLESKSGGWKIGCSLWVWGCKHGAKLSSSSYLCDPIICLVSNKSSFLCCCQLSLQRLTDPPRPQSLLVSSETPVHITSIQTFQQLFTLSGEYSCAAHGVITPMKWYRHNEVLLPLFYQLVSPDWNVKCTWCVWETKTCKHTGMVLTGSGSSAHITAVPPHLTPPGMMEEKRVTQSRGQREAFWGLVLQHVLQEVKKLVVLRPLWQQVLLQRTQLKREMCCLRE